METRSEILGSRTAAANWSTHKIELEALSGNATNALCLTYLRPSKLSIFSSIELGILGSLGASKFVGIVNNRENGVGSYTFDTERSNSPYPRLIFGRIVLVHFLPSVIRFLKYATLVLLTSRSSCKAIRLVQYDFRVREIVYSGLAALMSLRELLKWPYPNYEILAWLWIVMILCIFDFLSDFWATRKMGQSSELGHDALSLSYCKCLTFLLSLMKGWHTDGNSLSSGCLSSAGQNCVFRACHSSHSYWITTMHCNTVEFLPGSQINIGQKLHCTRYKF